MRLVVFMIEKNIFKLDKHFFFRERGGDFVNVLHMLRQCVKRFDTSTELFLRNKSIMHGFYNKKTIIRSQRFNLFFFSKYFLMYKDLFFVKYPILLVYRNARVFYRQHIFKKLKRVWRKR